ncbi:MAG: MlaE family lipid ABC transporter permease subunit [Pseudomonadota bacterium]
MTADYLTTARDDERIAIGLRGDWLFENVPTLEASLDEIDTSGSEPVVFHCGGLQNIDIAGAYVLFRKSQEIRGQGRETDFEGFKAAHFKFLNSITDLEERAPEAPAQRKAASRARSVVSAVGATAVQGVQDVGRIAFAILDGISKPSRIVWRETVSQFEQVAVRATPIIVMVCFLMGLVLAYQGATQLQKFGASIFVVDLVTISIIREMGVLLAAIIVAGRSGSAFAASIGVMNLNEETDALRVMGLNPDHVLVVPRVVALTIALPLLTVLANLAGLAGGAILCQLVLDISPTQFIQRTADAIDMADILVGLSKAPVFALLIAAVSTLRGLQVRSSAAELGRLTTIAVVQSITLIIVADGIFTVIFVRYGV